MSVKSKLYILLPVSSFALSICALMALLLAGVIR